MGDKKIGIVCLGDEQYFSTSPHAPIVALTSFRINFGNEVDYFCISRFSNARTLRLIEHNGLRPIHVDLSSVFYREHKSFWGSFPPEGFYLAAIPKLLLERSYEYCVVVDGDVYSNARFDIESAIDNADLSGVRQQPNNQINTGVLFMNNRRCVDKKFFEEFVRLYRTGGPYWSDQPLINDLVNAGRFNFRELDITYNLTLRSKKIVDVSENRDNILAANRDDVRIAHFMRGKPWQDHRKTPFNYAIRNYFADLYRRIDIKLLP